MKTFGYLIVVSESNTANYHQLAHALALSIKKTQPLGYDNIAIATDNKNWIPILKNIWAFDKVIFWDKETHWDGRSFMDEITPWDQTVCLDADMLFFSDYSHWIDKIREISSLYIPNKVLTFKGEFATGDHYRKLQKINDIPILYSAFTYFDKDIEISKEFFKLVKIITKYPVEFRNVLLDNDNGAILGTDEIFGLAAKLLGIADKISIDLPFPRIVHMKSRIQNCINLSDVWTKELKFSFDRNAELKIGNYEQTDIVHYVQKELITIDEINTYKRIIRKRIKDGKL
jgi:hypothetical protein